MQVKTCSACLDEKPLEDFPARKASKDGKAAICRPCKAQKDRAYREANADRQRERRRAYYQANRDKVLARNREWAAANKKRTREIKLAWYHRNPHQARAWRENNRDKTYASHRRYYEANRDAVIANVRRWQQENRERVREGARRRRAENIEHVREWARRNAHSRRGAALDALGHQWVDIISGDPCAYCGGVADEIDHITPITHGGTGDWTNLTPACRSCNARKHAKPLLGFLAA